MSTEQNAQGRYYLNAYFFKFDDFDINDGTFSPLFPTHSPVKATLILICWVLGQVELSSDPGSDCVAFSPCEETRKGFTQLL